jgi:hypothetical protein
VSGPHSAPTSFNFTMSRASMAAEVLRSSRFTASASLRSSSGFVGRRLQSSCTRWSRRETQRRAPDPGVEVHARVALVFHDARSRSTAPGRRGPVFPRLLRLPPPRRAARRLLDEAPSAGSKGRLRAPPRASPSSSLPSPPSPPLL